MLTFRQKLDLCWRILRKDESNSLRHADAELLRAFPPDATDSDMPGWNDAMRLQCQEVLTVFAAQGNSGMSASIATQAIERLMRFEPLTALTGKADEWTEVYDYTDEATGQKFNVFQNKRCPHVFKDVGQPHYTDPLGQNEHAYSTNGYHFIEPDGAAYQGSNSRKTIAFPYTPGESEGIKVDSEGVPLLKIHREQFGFPEPSARSTLDLADLPQFEADKPLHLPDVPRENAETFREYEKHHRDRADNNAATIAWRESNQKFLDDNPATEAARVDSFTKAERNRVMAEKNEWALDRIESAGLSIVGDALKGGVLQMSDSPNGDIRIAVTYSLRRMQDADPRGSFPHNQLWQLLTAAKVATEGAPD